MHLCKLDKKPHRCKQLYTLYIHRFIYVHDINPPTGFTPPDLHRQGGMGSVVDALVKAVEKHGGEVCTKLRVDEVPDLST